MMLTTLLHRIAVALLVAAAPDLPALPSAHPPPDRPAPADPTAPAETTAEPAPASEFSTLPDHVRPLVARRAKFVYRLPDGSVWDGYWYAELRAALADFDSSTTRAQIPPRALAWGFARGRRWPAGKDLRPDPLWHNPHHRPPSPLPFRYINATSPTIVERATGPHARVLEDLGRGFIKAQLDEFPGKESLRFPTHIGIGGGAAVYIKLPTGMSAKAGDQLRGEFFLIPDSTIELPRGAHRHYPTCRYIHAQNLRLTPTEYAAALLAGEAELIEWAWRRDPQRPDDGYLWTRRKIDVRAPADEPAISESTHDDAAPDENSPIPGPSPREH